jgi:amino acid adenylation domain-containing protein
LEIDHDKDAATTPSNVEQALQRIVRQHSMLRARFSHTQDNEGNKTLVQRVISADAADTWRFRVHEDVDNLTLIQNIVDETQASLDIVEGPVFAADLIITRESKTLLFMTAHHLVIDLVSWRILWEDLEGILRDHKYSLPPTLPFPLWIKHQEETLSKATPTPWPKADLAFWGMQDIVPSMAHIQHMQRTLDREQTTLIMGETCNAPLNTTPVMLMLTAIIQSFQRVFPERGSPALYNEGHGRDFDHTSTIDPSRTVGWFTTMMPLTVPDVNAATPLEDAVMTVKDNYQNVSAGATEHFASQVLQSGTFRRTDVEVLFNFAGRLQQVTRKGALLKLWSHPSVQMHNSAAEVEHVGLLSVLAYIDEDDKLVFTLDHDGRLAHQERISLWMQELQASLVNLVTELPSQATRLTLSDLPLLRTDHSGLRHIHARLAELSIPQENVEAIYPCTPLQEGVLLAQVKQESAGDAYNDLFAFQLTSREGAKIDVNRVVDAWKAVCNAHPILRTIFTNGLSGDSAFQQIVLKHTEPCVLLEKMPTGRLDIAQILNQHKVPCFSQTQPPHRLCLYTGPDNVVYSILDISHTVLDARTMRTIWEQIGREYSRRGSVAKGRSFFNYVAWLRSQEDVVQQYWRTYLAGAQPCLFPRDAVAADATYVTRGPDVPFKDAAGLLRFCQDQGVTVANFMQAAWAAVLRLYTGLPSVYFGCLRSDQDGLEGAADILGPLVTMLVCKFSFEDPTVTASSMLETAREDAVRGLQHSGCSLAQLHDDLGLSTSPLFDTIMTIQHAWPADLALGEGDLVVKPVVGEDPTEYSISVNVHYSKDQLFLRLSYQRSRLSGLLVEGVAETFAKVIGKMIEAPDQALLPSLEGETTAAKEPAPEKRFSLTSGDLALLKNWNSKTPVAVETCIPHKVRAIARQQPLSPAVCAWDRNLDYQQLDMLSDTLAYRIRAEYGMGTENIVPFACEKAASAIVILLAISKAGAAFLPLDITHSPDRLAAVLSDAGSSLVLVNSLELQDKMRECTSQTVLLVDLDSVEKSLTHDADAIRTTLESVVIEPAHAAYAVYTSGSTGTPKGILVDHRNIATSAEFHAGRLGMTAQSRLLQLANFSFDLSLGDIIYAFFSGACLCMPSEKEKTDNIAGAINRMQVNFLFATPTHATLLTPEDAPTLQNIALIGEPLRQENIVTWAPHVRLINAYGPAEAAVMASCRDVALGDNSQDIGHPLCCRFWVVDPDNHDNLVPIGTIGELIIEGPLVARGYVNRPEATAAAFIDPPAWTRRPEFSLLGLSSHRFYKTGDLVSQAGEKSFIYESRKGTQIKIRGLRIELGEIEYHLNHHAEEGWQWVVEVIQPSGSEDPCLAAFFETSNPDVAETPVWTGDSAPDPALLEPLTEEAAAAKEILKRSVPVYMVPDYFIHLQKVPTTSSMKTDRKTLREIAAGMSRSKLLTYRVQDKANNIQSTSPVSARKVATEDEILMQKAWTEVLNVPANEISAIDDFFNIGGNSIRAMHLVARLRKAGRALSVADVFKSSTLAEMVTKTAPLPAIGQQSVESLALNNIPQVVSGAIPGLAELAEKWTWLKSDNIESVAPATDTQAWMLAVGDIGGNGFDDGVSLKPSPGYTLDLHRLQGACEEVLRQHSILRTVFVQRGSQIFQVILRRPPVEQIHIWPNGQREVGELPVLGQIDITKTLPHFHLSSDGDSSCQNLELRIHHALYDAISLGRLLEDLGAAYAGRTLDRASTSFHGWISHVSSEDSGSAKGYWEKLLRGSMSYSLSSRISSPLSGNPADSKLRISVPLGNLQTSHGTAPSVLKAAWSLVLSEIFGSQDIVFGYISANRYSTRIPDIERVAGPCINILPVRASFHGHMSAASFLTGLQQQWNESIPHQHVGFRSIVKDCTRWPTSRFNSIIVFQNHDSLHSLIKLGDAECTFSGDGQVGDSSDVWLAAMPQPDGQLFIDLHYSSVNIPHEQARWISGYLEAMLNAFPGGWTRSVEELTHEVLDTAGSYPVGPGEERHFGDLVDAMLVARRHQDLGRDVTTKDVVDKHWR